MGGFAYVMGGLARKNAAVLKEWNQFEAGLVSRLDLETGLSELVMKYDSPPENCADKSPSILFKTSTVVGDQILACTETEVVVFSFPDFKFSHRISLPSFNDVHHVSATDRGTMLVVSTGLNMVQEVNDGGQVLGEWDVLFQQPYTGFDRTLDYRKVPSTKPHPSHPNFAFQYQGEVWATRFKQRDAVCLTAPEKNPIQTASEVGIHDGILHGGFIWFTSVDGMVIKSSLETGEVADVYDLRDLHQGNFSLGWCRGLTFVDENHVLVGFTRLRPTKFRENVRWIQYRMGMREHAGIHPSRLGLYNLKTRQHVRDYDLEDVGMSAVFSIHIADR
ncbi:MAG: hypothetical protein HQ519_00440 [Planctomycetes bacterium]|nr:hypothetical protein [Planctomycetota bacterium]